MNSRILFFITSVSLPFGAALAQDKEPEAPIPIKPAPSTPRSASSAEGSDYQQHPYGPAGNLVSPERARQIVDAFRGAYDKLGKPRVLIYVNRELVDENGGLRLTGRKEHTESTHGEKKSSFESDTSAPHPASTGTPQTQVNVNSTGPSSGHETTPGKGSSETRKTTVSADNTYSSTDKTYPTLADKQTVREVERLIGRAFRAAGASLADQKVASSMMADQPLDHFVTPTNDAARKDREALSKVADLVIEALISSRNVSVAAVSGDQTVPVPDIQITAVKLSDASIVGQASASDVLGKDQQAGRIARRFDVRDITEATALALMEDITTTTK